MTITLLQSSCSVSTAVVSDWKRLFSILSKRMIAIPDFIIGFDWVGLTSHQTHYRSYRGRILWVNDPTNSVKALTEDRFLWLRLQSHQVHPTALTIIQQLCSIKQKHTIYTQINTNESTHSEMGPVWQNPIQRTVRTTYLSVLMTVHSFSTQYNTEQFW